MPVQAPGPSLFSSIPFKHLAKQGQSSRASNVSLNLTPFVDMMTILVTFLLMLFGTGAQISEEKNVEMVKGKSERELIENEVPIIIVGKGTVSIKNGPDLSFNDIKNGRGVIVRLHKYMEDARKKAGKKKKDDKQRKLCETDGVAKYHQYWRTPKDDRPKGDPPKLCSDGVAILQADEKAPAVIVTRIVSTLNAAEYKTVLFATVKEDTKEN